MNREYWSCSNLFSWWKECIKYNSVTYRTANTVTVTTLPLKGGRINKNLVILNSLHYFKWGFLIKGHLAD